MINAWQFEKYVETALKICLLYEWKIFQVQVTSTKHKFTRHTHPTPDNNWTDILLHTQLSCKTYYLVVLNNINYYLSNLIFNFDGVSGRVECVALFARRPPRKKKYVQKYTVFTRLHYYGRMPFISEKCVFNLLSAGNENQICVHIIKIESA